MIGECGELAGRRNSLSSGPQVLLRAKRSGLLAEVRPTLLRMIEAGIFVGRDLYAEVLRLAGEDR